MAFILRALSSHSLYARIRVEYACIYGTYIAFDHNRMISVVLNTYGHADCQYTFNCQSQYINTKAFIQLISMDVM